MSAHDGGARPGGPATRRRRATPARASSARATSARAAPYGFLAPTAVLFLLFFALPIGYALYLSLRRVRIVGLGLGPDGREQVWAGLANYRAALSDSELLAGALRVLGYGAIVVPVMLGLALFFALLLDDERVRGRRFGRLTIFLPYAVPGVIAALLWGFLYLPSVSPVTDTIERLGLPAPDLLTGAPLYGALANIAIWGGTGFNMIVIYTALRAIPAEVHEAARLDGCTPFQTALRVKIPMVLPSLVLTFFFSIIATLQVFNEPTTLRPLTNNLSTTWSPLMKVYEDAFTGGDIHAAAATAVVIALVTLVLSFGFLRLATARNRREENAR